MKFRTPTHFVAIAVTLIGLSACSSKPHIKEFPESANAEQEITNLKVAIDHASRNNVELLSPENFKEARESLSDAQKLKKDDASNTRVLEEVAEGRAYLQRAEKIASDNENSMQDVVVARSEAIKANAHVVFNKRFADIDSAVREESRKLEDEEYSDLKDKKAHFISDYKNIELDAIKQKHIGKAKNALQSAEESGARDITPKTYAEADKAYRAADTYITKNRYNEDGIAERAAVANAAAEKLSTTFGKARTLEKTSAEETALRMQTNEEKLSKTQSALTREHGTVAALAADNIELSREKELDRIYEEARAKFSPDEAEVYKQGKNLVIRLRGLEFPKNEAVIRGENFALLRKVDDVIASFGKSEVTVEGHTDSTGGRTLNQRLSDDRADAVSKYLEANTQDGVADFSAKGFGFEKPIASNKSAEGRAQNRRVDVIIEPTEL